MDADVVRAAVKDDPDALAFLRAIACVLHTWDDLVDRDQDVSDEAVHQAFTLALIDLPRNAFYQRHFAELNPLLMQAITNWHIANVYERRETLVGAELRIAFVLRSSYVDLLTMSATLIGGKAWGVEAGVAIRRWAHSEGYGQYLDNLAAERAARAKE